MLPALAARVVRETDPRVLWKFCYNFGFKGVRSVERFKRRLARGEHFPPFLYISIINSCNLRCQGCWVKVDGPQQMIEAATLRRVIADAKAQGNSFFGILGGEPFMHPQLLEVLGREVELKLEARNILGRGHEEFQDNGTNRIDLNTYDIGTTFGASLSVTL